MFLKVRNFKQEDMESVLSVWLEASIQAHHFVEANFWKNQVKSMREVYIPNSETFVIESHSNILGFYSLVQNSLAAIFVAPSHQGQGYGKQLLLHAKSKRKRLSLNVYKQNIKSVKFYLAHGFQIVSEQNDEHTDNLEYVMSTVC